jgi:tetratricopeptide (TPR) repeat protein
MEQAILELDAAIADDPSNISALLLRGRLKMQGRHEEAIADLERVLRLDPRNSNALATRAVMLMGLDDQGALREATKAVEFDPANVDALWIRATMLIRQGKLDEAERDLSSAIAIEPDEPRTLLSRAQVRMQLGKGSEAAQDATAVIAARHDLDAYQIRAVVRGRSGDYAGALDDLNAVLAHPSALPGGGQFVELYVQRAIALVRTGKPAEAKRDLDSIVKLGGRRAVMQMQLYLRGHGFPDVKLDGARSDQLDDALQACFINDACGRGIAIPG